MGDWQICALLLNIQQLIFAFVINAEDSNQKDVGIVFGVLFFLFYAFVTYRLYEKKSSLHSQKLSVFGDFKQQF
jgi:positive regulator of sigma E activity